LGLAGKVAGTARQEAGRRPQQNPGRQKKCRLVVYRQAAGAGSRQAKPQAGEGGVNPAGQVAGAGAGRWRRWCGAAGRQAVACGGSCEAVRCGRQWQRRAAGRRQCGGGVTA